MVANSLAPSGGYAPVITTVSRDCFLVEIKIVLHVAWLGLLVVMVLFGLFRRFVVFQTVANVSSMPNFCSCRLLCSLYYVCPSSFYDMPEIKGSLS